MSNVAKLFEISVLERKIFNTTVLYFTENLENKEEHMVALKKACWEYLELIGA